MKKLSLIFILLFVQAFVFSQLATNDWRIHVSFTNPSAIATDNKLVMCAFENGLLEYDIEASETSIWSYTNYLSDVRVSTVHYDSYSESFWVGYVNGNIDRISNNTVHNIPYLKLANIIGSKKINSFTENNGIVYAVADFGILAINPLKNEIKETYYTNNDGFLNLEIVFLNDSIYTLTSKGLYAASKNNPILADYSQWHLIPSTAISGDSLRYTKMALFGSNILMNKNKDGFGEDTVIQYTNGSISYPINEDLELKDIKVLDDQLYVVHQYGVFVYDQLFNEKDIFFQYQFANIITSSSITKTNNGAYYIADNSFGMVKFTNNWNNSVLSPSGPAANIFYRANSLQGELIFSAGRIGKSGPEFNNSGVYTLKDEEWKYYSRFNQTKLDTLEFWDMNGVAINPKDKNTIAISACGGDYSLFIIKDHEQISELYGPANTEIEGMQGFPEVSCISEVQYDKKGNLWMININSNYPLKVLTKDGLFYKFNTGTITRNKFVEKLTIDNDGNPWFSVPGVGIVGYFTKGTIEDPSDDNYKILDKGENTGALPNNEVTDIILTKDNKLWITTSLGFSILSNPTSVAEASYGGYNTYRPKVNYGGNTEYFFGETFISCGTVDGGNRKWLGTENAGLFCLSEDGYSIVYEFNTANSKLISNTIYDLEFNGKTGELFVLTDLGLVSLRVDASDGRDDYKEVIVFPNPVQPDYDGVVTIQGIKTNSDVKVTDMAGNIVYETTSNGGTATWNCRKVNGEEVATGVYLIWTAPKEGKGRKVGKVTVIR